MKKILAAAVCIGVMLNSAVLMAAESVLPEKSDTLSSDSDVIQSALKHTPKIKIKDQRIDECVLHERIVDFIKTYKKKHLTDEYVKNLLEAFVELIDDDYSNVEDVLYFIALCSVESNFDQNVPTKYGTGIAQVCYKVHKKYIAELGVTVEEFRKSPKHNIYVGYNIFKCYFKSCKYNLSKTATRYNGNATRGYAKKVDARYNHLLKLIKE